MMKIAIFGSGAFGREVAMLIEQINAVQQQWELVGFFDDGSDQPESINGYPYLGKMQDLNAYPEPLALAIGIGNPKIKKAVREKIVNPGISFPVLIHPTVLMGRSDLVSIGEGTIITAYNVITVNVTIGRFVILNLTCTVGHDCVLEDYVSVMPGTNISGSVHIEEGVYLGTGVQIINNRRVGKNSIVGAGAVVARSLPPNITAIGVPARGKE